MFANDRPILLVWDNTGSNARIATLLGSANTLWGYTDGLGYNGNYTTLGVSAVAPSYIFNEIVYKPSSTLLEWYGSNTSTLGSVKKQLTAASSTGILNEVQIGSYFGTIQTPSMSVVEVITINGLITPSDLTNLQSYFNTTYGI
jgi:hypothetical protein